MTCPSIFDVCTPRKDVLDGTFTEADFAADLASVLSGTASAEYRDPARFFAQTYPTEGLKTLLSSVCGRLAGDGTSLSPIFRLDTTYGGGKTHALIALAHAARGLDGVPNAGEFVPAGKQPANAVRIAAFDGENADPNNGRPLADGTRAYTPWGEIAYALAGPEGYEMVRASDEARAAPGAETIKQLFGGEPTLILLDELSIYLRKLTPGARTNAGGQLTAFLTSLFRAVESAPNAAVVYTLAVGKDRIASDAYRQENQFIADAMQEAESVSARKATLLDPTEEDETVQVLVRRLFESVDEDKKEQVLAAYHETWSHNSSLLPSDGAGAQRLELFRRAYPFHPELIDTLRYKTATLGDFQRVRGMLRLLGRTIGRLWSQRPSETYAVHLYHMDPGFEPVRQEITTRLGQRQFLPALRADVAAVEGEESALAQRLDEQAYSGLAPYASMVARTVFLHSLAFNEQLRGASKEELRFAVLAPGLEVSFVDDALTRFQQASAYLDDRPTAPLRFQAEANLTQIIRRQEANVDPSQVRSELNDKIRQIFSGGRHLNIVAFPTGPYDVPDDDGDGKPYLVIVNYDAAEVAEDALEVPELVGQIYERTGSSGELRKNRNNLAFVLAEGARKSEMRQQMVRRLALQDLLRPERLNELADHQQDQMREKARQSEAHVATTIQQCYRHVLYPSRNRIRGAGVDLAHAVVEVPTASQTPGDGQKYVVQVLRDSKKLRLPEDDPDSPSYVRDRTPLRKGRISIVQLRAEFRRDPSLPMLVGDDVFLRGIRQGIERGEYVYRHGELIGAAELPQSVIKIEEQAELFTATYARDQGIWPKPEPDPATPSTGGDAPGTPAPVDGPTEPLPANEPDPPPHPGPAQPQAAELSAEGPLKEALATLWDQARGRGIARIGRLTLELYDAGDGFRVLSSAAGVPKASMQTQIEAQYETADGGTLGLNFSGPSADVGPVKDFLEPQLRAATQTDCAVTITLSFHDGVDPSGDEPEKVSERLARYGGGVAYVTASAVPPQEGRG